MRKIDAHRHLLHGEGELSGLLKEMDDHGIERTVLMPLPPELAFMGKHPEGNEAVFKAATAHPDRLSAAVYLDPRHDGTVQEMHRYADAGAVAVKLWPPIGYHPGDEAYYPVYEQIAARGLPLLAHTGYTNMPNTAAPRAAADSRFAMPVEFDGLIRAFPEITFILAHGGDPDFATAILQAHANPNVYLNICGMADETGWDARIFRFYEIMQGACAPLEFDKLIWGSDNLGYDFLRYKAIFDGCGRADALAGFFGGNAAELLLRRG